MALSHVTTIVNNAGLVGSTSNSHQLTVGQYSVTYPGGSGLPTSTTNYRGLSLYSNWDGSGNYTDDYGAITPAVSSVYLDGSGNGLPFGELYYQWSTVYNISRLLLYIDTNQDAQNSTAAALPNSGWTTLTIDGTAYTRSAATYSSTSPTDRTWWRWVTSTTDYNGSQNPFPAAGQTATCVFT